MVATALRLAYSFRDYVSFEREARERHEFVGGVILAMAGGTLEHGALTAAVIASLSAQLGGRPCRVFDSNARVRVAATGNAYYPDASVVCGALEVDPDDALSMANPALLVEVLSPSTAEHYRTDKLADYKLIPSLRHVVHVAHDDHRIDVWTRATGGWATMSYRETEIARLNEIGCSLDVSETYRDPLSGG